MENENTELEKCYPPSGWQICPKCTGQGLVSKPTYLAGDINSWASSQISHTCNLCKGKMIINIDTGLPPSNPITSKDN